MVDPKDTFVYDYEALIDKDPDISERTVVGAATITINAQTGEMLDPHGYRQTGIGRCGLQGLPPLGGRAVEEERVEKSPRRLCWNTDSLAGCCGQAFAAGLRCRQKMGRKRGTFRWRKRTAQQQDNGLWFGSRGRRTAFCGVRRADEGLYGKKADMEGMRRYL